jgi:hypothetical protein
MTVFQQVLWMFVNNRLQDGQRIAKQPRSLWGAARPPKYRVPQTGSAPGGRTTFPPSCTFPLYCLRRFGDEHRHFKDADHLAVALISFLQCVLHVRSLGKNRSCSCSCRSSMCRRRRFAIEQLRTPPAFTQCAGFVSNALSDTGMETTGTNGGGSASRYPPIVLLAWTSVFRTMSSVCSTRAAQDKFRYRCRSQTVRC